MGSKPRLEDEMLFLNESDMKKSVTYQQVMDKVEDGYRIFAGGKFYMPHRPVIEHGKNTLLYMPCFMGKYFGTKCLTLFPDNPSKGLPFIDGLMILNDGETGKTLAILDARFLTALRTGAVGGVGTRCFAPAESRSVGLIGAGKQGFFQLLYACEARNIEEIFIFDAVLKEFGGFIEALKKELGDKKPLIRVCQTAEELVTKSDIVITATTSSSPVVLDDPELFVGKCFIAIGSYKPEVRELPNAIWKAVDVVYTELPFACEESGDLCQPIRDGIIDMSRVKYIGDLLTSNPRPTPPNKGAASYFKSVGMGLMDLCVSQLIYAEAVKKGIGRQLD
jgi:ornithine cyclodeaminase/alanine dehydrogenase-like protein (mu-crystallin family)